MTESVPAWIALDKFVAAFESARGANSTVDLASFLPERHDPLYRAVLVELVRVDMELARDAGRPRRLESYRHAFPELFRDLEALRAVAFEEYRLRQQAGETIHPDEYLRRFEILDIDRGPEAVGVASRTHQLVASAAVQDGELSNAKSAAPLSSLNLGQEFLGFHLDAELGRGAFSRVFLARQTDLAGRRVVLKVSPSQFNEQQTLAQLQHTNIVPIYSVHDAGQWQAVCMPYFGSTTLADLLHDLSLRQVLPQSSRELNSTLQGRNRSTLTNGIEYNPVPAIVEDDQELERGSPPLNLWREFDDVQTLLWIGACLAEGLAYAHERGILHRDLKPANILITDEGQPMLLDFNLACDTKLNDLAEGSLVGGTLPYMSPEQLVAYHTGRGTPDARADVYSLGVVLYEALTGHLPHEAPQGSLREVLPQMIAARRVPQRGPRHWNPALTPAVESILQRCLAPDAGDRYQSARELQEDLHRQLEHRPLRYAKDRSIRERWRKWRRRHPQLMSSTSVTVIMALLLSAVVGSYELRQRSLASLKAADAFHQLQSQTQSVAALLAHSDAQLPEIEEGLKQSRQAVALYGVLEHSDWKQSGLMVRLPSNDQAEVEERLGEILLLWARGLSWQATRRGGDHELLHEALKLNEQAGRCLGESQSLPVLTQRAKLLRQLGEQSQAEAILAQTKDLVPRTARERFLSVVEALGDGKYRDNFAFLREACRQDTKSVVLWMVLGNCYASMGQLDEAIRCYDVAEALSPHSAWPTFHRGLANLERKEYAAARSDFDRVLAEKPALHEARVNRALAWLGLREYQQADADLTQALAAGEPGTRTYFLRAQARSLAGDARGAASDRAEGLRRVPTDELSWIARGVARIAMDPAGAIEDFDEALRLNPRSPQALQNKAHVLSERLNRSDEAIAVLDQAIELNPEFQPAWSGRGVLLARSKKRAAALRDAEHALSLNKSPIVLYQAANVYALTSVEMESDRVRSLELLKQAMRADPELLRLVVDDQDFAALRSVSEFQDLVAVANALEAPPP